MTTPSLTVPILYEDTDFLVINKPAGLVVHADGKSKELTLVDWILNKYPEMKEVGEPLTLSNGTVIFRPGIVHRIDRETSGILLIAKNQPAYLHAKEQFQDRTITKTYHLFVHGSVQAMKGKIDRPIGRSKNDFRKWTAQRGTRGELREAVTEYKLLAKGGSRDEFYSYVEAHPLTGRTHQIRVHFKAINHPVVADPLYGPERHSPGPLGFERLALHASFIAFTDMKGNKVEVKAPLPADFEIALQKLKELEKNPSNLA